MSSVCGGGQTNRNSACGGCGFIPKNVTRQACEGGGKMAGRLPVRRTEMRGDAGGEWEGEWWTGRGGLCWNGWIGGGA